LLPAASANVFSFVISSAARNPLLESFDQKQIFSRCVCGNAKILGLVSSANLFAAPPPATPYTIERNRPRSKKDQDERHRPNRHWQFVAALQSMVQLNFENNHQHLDENRD
jgi:hypothetical protein